MYINKRNTDQYFQLAASLKENPFQLKAPKKLKIENCKDANVT